LSPLLYSIWQITHLNKKIQSDQLAWRTHVITSKHATDIIHVVFKLIPIWTFPFPNYIDVDRLLKEECCTIVHPLFLLFYTEYQFEPRNTTVYKNYSIMYDSSNNLKVLNINLDQEIQLFIKITQSCTSGVQE